MKLIAWNHILIGDIGESSDISLPGPSIPREPFYKGFGVVFLPGDINGLVKKLHLLAAEFFKGNTSVRNELVHVLGALLRLN